MVPVSSDDFEEVVATLRAFCLIDIGLSNDLFDMHRRVQLSTKQWLERRGELEKWQCQYIYILRDFFPNERYANRHIRQQLFPHVEMMAKYRLEDRLARIAWSEVLSRGTDHAGEIGRWGVAERMGLVTLETQEQLLGSYHLSYLRILLGVGQIVHDLERIYRGEEMVRTAQFKMEEVAEVDDGKAGEKMRLLLTKKEKVLGVDHKDIRETFNTSSYGVGRSGESRGGTGNESAGSTTYLGAQEVGREVPA